MTRINPNDSDALTPKTRHLYNVILVCGLLAVLSLLFYAYKTFAICIGTEPCTRVLFIGNSYTSVNDLPATFTALAKSGGHAVQTNAADEGGWTLDDHVKASETANLLSLGRWDYVVLQEQSQFPSVEPYRTQIMYPAARSLVQQVRATGAQPIFFLTWAHRDGWPEEGLTTYEAMQARIDAGYLGIAGELDVPVAPVGPAWQAAMQRDPQLALWQSDNSHPTQQGTYLAACVFYAAIFRQSPVGLSYTAGLPADTAGELQSIAADTVLNNPSQWNLP
ncbi:MAG TPA: DUF4886 domain-containing protein [Longilinea sp.]|nr:DUF4886 domain-containing protein [Longilinea sp.]